MPSAIVSIIVRIILAIIVGIVVGFIIWLLGWVIINFLGVTAAVVALGGIIEGIGYFAGVLAALWFLFAGYKHFPTLP